MIAHPKRRILYLINSMEGGGAESQVAVHLRLLRREKFEVELALCRKVGIYLADLPEDVEVHELSNRRPLKTAWRVRSLRRIVDEGRFDAVVSNLWYCDLLSLLENAGRRNPVPRVCVIHSDHRRLLTDLKRDLRWSARMRLRLAHKLYHRAAKVLFLTEGNARYLCAAASIRRERAVVLPHSVDVSELQERARAEPPPEWPGDGLRLLAAGRLTHPKGFDNLLRVFATARKRGLRASLLIIGDGPDRRNLEVLSERLGITDHVALPGFVSNPHAAYRAADLVLNSSRLEGFCMVILEALAQGKPVLATDCPSGPGEILRDGAGVLVPTDDWDAFTDALLRLASSEQERQELGERALQRAHQYAHGAIMPRFEQLLLDLPARDGQSAPAEHRTAPGPISERPSANAPVSGR